MDRPNFRFNRSADSWIGSQRVLDLVGDAARDIRPGSAALRRDQIADVVEGDDVAVRRPCGPFGGDANVYRPLAPVARDRDLVAVFGAVVAQRRRYHRFERGHEFRDQPADCSAFVDAEEAERGTVGDGDATLRVDADDAGGDAGEHRLGEPAAGIDLIAGGDQFLALGAKLGRHRVEGGAKRADVAVGIARLDGDLQIAARNLLGRVDEPSDRGHQPIGEADPQPDGRQEHDDRHAEEEDAEGDLDAEARGLQRSIFGDVVVGHRQVANHLRVQRPGAVEEDVVIAGQRGDPADDVGLARRHDHHLVGLVLRLLDRLDDGRRELVPVGRAGLRDQPAVAADQEHTGKAVLGGQ